MTLSPVYSPSYSWYIFSYSLPKRVLRVLSLILLVNIIVQNPVPDSNEFEKENDFVQFFKYIQGHHSCTHSSMIGPSDHRIPRSGKFDVTKRDALEKLYCRVGDGSFLSVLISLARKLYWVL